MDVLTQLIKAGLLIWLVHYIIFREHKDDKL